MYFKVLLFNYCYFIMFPKRELFSMLYLLLIIYTPLKRAGHVTGSFILLIFFIFINPKASHTLLTAVALNNKSPVYCRSLYSSKTLPAPDSQHPRRSRRFPATWPVLSCAQAASHHLNLLYSQSGSCRF